MKATPYSAKTIGKILDGEHQIVSPDSLIESLLFDSRKGGLIQDSLFVALPGNFRDGHQFVETMYKRGVRDFLVSKPIPQLPNANIFRVPNTLAAIQRLATCQRNSASFPIIGITGSNGKTIIKEWLYQLLHEDFTIVRNPKSYNSQLGVALSVWKINQSYNLGIFEAGLSQCGEMEILEKIIQPSIGIFTNLGLAHQENFSDIYEKAKEKMKLFKNVEKLIFCTDSEIILNEVNQLFSREKQLRWGRYEECDLNIMSVAHDGKKSIVKAIYDSKDIQLSIPFLDDASIENGIHCWLYMLNAGYSNSVIQSRFNRLEPIAMRLEQKIGIDGSVILNDSYNADVTAISIAFDSLDRLGRSKKTVILSDILQSGSLPDQLYEQINLELANHQIYQFIGVGKEIYENQNLITIPNRHFFLNTYQFLDQIQSFDFQNQAILIKGARSFKFEQIASKLALRTHQTRLEINLDAIKHNLHFFRQKLQPKVKIMVMVKAYGYGAGGPEVSNILESEGVNYLGVAYADEGMAIRKAGVNTPIMVMNPSKESFPSIINYNLEPEIYSLKILEAYNDALNAEGLMRSAYPIHIKLDTGMNRLGFRAEELSDLLQVLKSESHFKIASVFSHLAASDAPENDPFTNAQIALFKELIQQIKTVVTYPFIQHISNTAAIERFPDAQFNMVRLGLGLYGVTPSGTNQNQLETVSSLYSIVIQLKNVKEGESIGYGRNFIAKKDMKIAIVPIGYADGVDRRLGNGVGFAFVSEFKRPIIGNVCMDLLMVDVTGLPTKINDRVEIFGHNISVEQVASQAETISYEILSSIPPRVKRVYIKEVL
tara:strand:- start:144497 stop:146974 length:2478 start_codon:yes stop_codon:yes gene_type:complete